MVWRKRFNTGVSQREPTERWKSGNGTRAAEKAAKERNVRKLMEYIMVLQLNTWKIVSFKNSHCVSDSVTRYSSKAWDIEKRANRTRRYISFGYLGRFAEGSTNAGHWGPQRYSAYC